MTSRSFSLEEQASLLSLSRYLVLAIFIFLSFFSSLFLFPSFGHTDCCSGMGAVPDAKRGQVTLESPTIEILETTGSTGSIVYIVVVKECFPVLCAK